MPQPLTKHQQFVLRTMLDGGKIVSVVDEDKREHSLVDKDTNNTYIQNNTINRLLKDGYINVWVDRPAFGVDTWYITGKGREWVEMSSELLTRDKID